VKKTISKFKDVVHSATFRKSDGKLIVAGGDYPVVKLFDIKSRTQLRQFKGHSGAVKVAKFSIDAVHVLSGSNDKTMRCWDIASEQQLHCWTHEDYIRCGCVSPSSPDLWVSGSYDHTVKIWDRRQSDSHPVMTLEHGYPVEDLLIFPSGSILLSVGRNEMNYWDLLAGGKLLHQSSNHQKTITCCCMDAEGQRILSGGIDHYIKVYDVKTFQVLHTMTTPAPILSLGLSPDSTKLVVGMSDGILQIRTRHIKQSLEKEDVGLHQQKEQLRTGHYRYFLRGKNRQASREDYAVATEKRIKLKAYDRLLKRFQFSLALTETLKTKNVIVIVSMFEELMRRSVLDIALQGKDEFGLKPILEFILEHITNPRYREVLVDVTNMLLDLYYGPFGESTIIDDLFRKLEIKLAHELKFERQLFQVIGALDLLMASSTGQRTNSTLSTYSIDNDKEGGS